jgi:hypothetical protein
MTNAGSQMGRSIAAVFGGFLTVVILSIGTDAAMHAAAIFPPSGQPMAASLFALATAYRAVYAIAGSYLAAKLAPHRPMLHAMILGAIGLVACVAGAVATWNNGPEFGPHWYPLALIATAIPGAWLGGLLGSARQAQPDP